MRTKPQALHFTPPSHSCDSHCHVFGPAELFAYADTRKYTPNDAPKEQLFALHKKLGFSRSVLVQASCHGTDNRAMINMLLDAPGRYRGIAIIDDTFALDDLQSLHKAGVRGVRFNFLPRLMDIKPREYYLNIANKIVELGWHIVVYFESASLRSIDELLRSLPCPIVIDHMGRPDASLPIAGKDFQRVCNLLRDNSSNWIKVSGIERLSRHGAPYGDALPFAKYLIEHFPNQVLWGTDWPHPNMEANPPDDCVLVNSIPLIATSAALQTKILVDNPHKLYCFEDETHP